MFNGQLWGDRSPTGDTVDVRISVCFVIVVPFLLSSGIGSLSLPAIISLSRVVLLAVTVSSVVLLSSSFFRTSSISFWFACVAPYSASLLSANRSGMKWCIRLEWNTSSTKRFTTQIFRGNQVKDKVVYVGARALSHSSEQYLEYGAAA